MTIAARLSFVKLPELKCSTLMRQKSSGELFLYNSSLALLTTMLKKSFALAPISRQPSKYNYIGTLEYDAISIY